MHIEAEAFVKSLATVGIKIPPQPRELLELKGFRCMNWVADLRWPAIRESILAELGILGEDGEGRDADSLVDNAALAMYTAKARGKNSSAFYASPPQ